MFENNNPLPSQNPLNPVMPAPGMPSSQGPAPVAPQPFTPPAPQVHSMPERFRNTGSSSGGPSGSSKTKKLLITLIIIIVVAGLGVAGLFIFNKVVKSNTNNANTTNTTNTTNTVSNTANRNTNLNTNVANQNGNVSNVNSLGNLNSNTSANVNSVVNDNTNVSTNTNTTNTNTVTNTSTNTNTAISTTKLLSNTDTDSDGITDTEELVYGTSASKADTDGDGFVDGMKVQANGTIVGELYKGYNPMNADVNAKLEGSSLVKRVLNGVATYSLLIPTNWKFNESSGLMVVTPDATTGELFQIRTRDNAGLLTPQAWYTANEAQLKGSVSLTTSITAFNGFEGLISPDGSSVYLFRDAQVFVLNYYTASLTKVNFWTTFEVMWKSFKLVAA